MQTLPTMDCCQAYKLGWQNFAKCDGRARRSEYWYFVLGNWLIGILLSVLGGLLNFIYLPLIFYVIVMIPMICLTVRRLHDIGKSGVYYLFVLIPIVGFFIILYFCLIDSEERQNEYGPSPKYILPQNGALLNNNNNYVQPNIVAVPVNPYPQPNPVPPQVAPYPQPNPMPPQVAPYPNPTPYTGQPIPPPQGFAPY